MLPAIGHHYIRLAQVRGLVTFTTATAVALTCMSSGVGETNFRSLTCIAALRVLRSAATAAIHMVPGMLSQRLSTHRESEAGQINVSFFNRIAAAIVWAGTENRFPDLTLVSPVRAVLITSV